MILSLALSRQSSSDRISQNVETIFPVTSHAEGEAAWWMYSERRCGKRTPVHAIVTELPE
jgi:hypothetical protein